MRALWLALAFVGLVPAAQAQTWQIAPSTPDIAVAATSMVTLDIRAFLGSPASWFRLKNDGPGDLYFDLRGNRDASANDFPLRLKDSETFEVQGQLWTLAVSHGDGAASTFTLVLGR